MLEKKLMKALWTLSGAIKAKSFRSFSVSFQKRTKTLSQV